ncbi:MAG: DUF4832 domain-containing protein [Paludibacteraceae bacterium]|nr:DUF4832 domain-containing protein [Paludibacteraceae bacterium]
MVRVNPYSLVFWCSFAPLSAEPHLQNIDYTDALEVIENPYVGFYRPVVKHFTIDGNSPSNTWGNVTHLRMDISAFSDNAVLSVDKANNDTTWGVSQPLTQDMLDAFEAMLDGIRKRGKTAIVRFAYDPWYNGTKNCDPNQSVILLHLKQLGEIYSRNSDVITFVELGMYGSWGEMHSSSNGSNENIAEALQTLLKNTSPEIKIGVRRPDIVACWLKVNDGNDYSGFDIDSEKFKEAAAAKGDTIYRVGMYNDGYLGSYSDLGTVGMGASGHQMTRELMVKWLNEYSSHTPYGGELVANYNGDSPINTPTYLSVEGFQTHTSYLNYEWHQPTILAWKDSVFQGHDAEYNGVDGYTYVVNHIGYRFILRESLLPERSSSSDVLPIELVVENVGFANLSKQKKVTFVLTDGTDTYELPADDVIDPQEWLSRRKVTVKTSITLPSDLADGRYKLYLRLSEQGDWQTDGNLYCIQFGNPSLQYDKNIGANYIGEICIENDATGLLNNVSKDMNCLYSSKDDALYLSQCREIGIYSMSGECLYEKTGMEGGFIVNLEPITEKTIIVTITDGKRRITKKYRR